MGTTQECYLEQIPEATAHETIAVRPLISHLKNQRHVEIAGETSMKSYVSFFYEPLHIEMPVLSDPQKLIYI